MSAGKQDADLSSRIGAAAESDKPLVSPLDEDPDLSVGLPEHKLEFEVSCLQQEFDQLSDNHDLRLSYTGKIFWLVAAWLTCVVICVLLSGFNGWGFKLSDTVMISFITSTTINVVGLFVLVAKWMFPSGKPTPEHKELLSRAKAVRVAGKNQSKSSSRP